MSYERIGNMPGFAKNAPCKGLKRKHYKRPKMSGEVLELDGVWTSVADKKVELMATRNKRGGGKFGRHNCEAPSRRRRCLNMASGERFNDR